MAIILYIYVNFVTFDAVIAEFMTTDILTVGTAGVNQQWS